MTSPRAMRLWVILALLVLGCDDLFAPRSVLSFRPADDSSVSKALQEGMRSVLERRLASCLQFDWRLSSEGETLRIELANSKDEAMARRAATTIGELRFLAADQSLPRGSGVSTGNDTVVAGGQIEWARLQRLDPGGWELGIGLKEEGKQRLASYSAANVGRFVVLVLDGVVDQSWLVTSAIPDGRVLIASSSDPDEARWWLGLFRSGALPYRLVEKEAFSGAT